MLFLVLGSQLELEALGIPVVKYFPGVDENLHDHPKTIIMGELLKPVPPETTMDSDATLFMRNDTQNSHGNDQNVADVMMHCCQIPFTLNTARLKYPLIRKGYAFCMTPNISRPKSRGKLYLTFSDPSVKPALDFRYFTDPGGLRCRYLGRWYQGSSQNR